MMRAVPASSWTFSAGTGETASVEDPTSDVGILPRILAIMELFTAQEGCLTVPQMVERSGLPKSTAHRLVRQLAGVGFLVRDGHGYWLGTRLLMLSRHGYAARLREVAVPELQHLLDMVNGYVHLAILEGDRPVSVECFRRHDADLPIPTQPGAALPPHSTALGKAL